MNKENFINRWKATAEELRLQLHLGSKEISDKFEEQKREILDWSRETRSTLASEASGTSKDLRVKLEELEVQAALGKAETKEALQEQRKKLSSLISEANEASIKLMGDSKKNVRELALKADARFDEWHTRFDLLRLQISLGAAEATDEWKERSGEMKSAIQHFETKLSNITPDSDESWANLKSGVTEAWANVKNSFRRVETNK